jgi:hypothetical protein
MGYKLLGFVVWQGLRLYLRRRFPDARRNLAIAGATGVVLAGAAVGAVAAQRARSS